MSSISGSIACTGPGKSLGPGKLRSITHNVSSESANHNYKKNNYCKINV